MTRGEQQGKNYRRKRRTKNAKSLKKKSLGMKRQNLKERKAVGREGTVKREVVMKNMEDGVTRRRIQIEGKKQI